ncbi:hypothetical protein F5B21DRAFT_523159 [Xylaria acuta]|nr:hypothetical protein F5B21DRAFT_523159 [Xylaria acuta]
MWGNSILNASVAHFTKVSSSTYEQSGDPRLLGVLDDIVEAYTGERGFMSVHRYKVFGILEVAGETGRTVANGSSGTADKTRPSTGGTLNVEPHQRRRSFEECRYISRVLSRSFVDSDPSRTIALVTPDPQEIGVTFMPDDRLTVMPLNSWEECAKVAAALGLGNLIDDQVEAEGTWSRFERHLASVRRTKLQKLTVKDILRRGHLAPITKELALKVHSLLRASSNTILQVLGTDDALMDTPPQVWDEALDLDELSWLNDLISLEVPRTYSIAGYTEALLPSTVDFATSRAEYKLCSTFAGQEDMTVDDEVIFGVSHPAAFQLPLGTMAPCAFFAGGSGIAPFQGFWQSRFIRGGISGGKNYLYLGVQSREKFCFEEGLREHVSAGFMEVHLAFSRDSRGLAYDPYLRDLVERPTPPRSTDIFIQEQGATVSELVMSKKNGGLGGYLYYTALSRFMLDVFMTPNPLSCNLPTIPMSQLALHTGHRPGSRMWIGVHGSVYDVTDFPPMHPGGTMIIKSNAGVDCIKSFDNLAHTNNPEVSSLLTKYFVGDLTPEPDFRDNSDEMKALYDLWVAYLCTAVETLVAHQFEMYEIMSASLDSLSSHDPAGSNNIWLRESLPSTIAVRTFYGYQSRLLQGGFAALFGPKLQEIVLKLSFSLANASGPGAQTQVPDILGAVARAKTSADAITCTRELALVDRGVFAYASKSVELDIGLLEDLRQEACDGMDAFDNIATTNPSLDRTVDPDLAADKLNALCTFLLQILERINPARTRWTSVRRLIRDGSFFVLTHSMGTHVLQNGQPSSFYVSCTNVNQNVGFDTCRPTVAIPDRRRRRCRQPGGDADALRAINNFVETNNEAIRRLRKLPATAMSFDELKQISQAISQLALTSNQKPRKFISSGRDFEW